MPPLSATISSNHLQPNVVPSRCPYRPRTLSRQRRFRRVVASAERCRSYSGVAGLEERGPEERSHRIAQSPISGDVHSRRFHSKLASLKQPAAGTPQIARTTPSCPTQVRDMPTEAEPTSSPGTAPPSSWRGRPSPRGPGGRRRRRRHQGRFMSEADRAEATSPASAPARRRRAAGVSARRGVAAGVRGEDAPPAVADAEERAAFELPGAAEQRARRDGAVHRDAARRRAGGGARARPTRSASGACSSASAGSLAADQQMGGAAAGGAKRWQQLDAHRRSLRRRAEGDAPPAEQEAAVARAAWRPHPRAGGARAVRGGGAGGARRSSPCARRRVADAAE